MNKTQAIAVSCFVAAAFVIGDSVGERRASHSERPAPPVSAEGVPFCHVIRTDFCEAYPCTVDPAAMIGVREGDCIVFGREVGK